VFQPGLNFIRNWERFCRASDKKDRLRVRRLVELRALSQAIRHKLCQRSIGPWMSVKRATKLWLCYLKSNDFRFCADCGRSRGGRINGRHFPDARSFAAASDKSIVDKHATFARQKKVDVVVGGALNYEILAQFNHYQFTYGSKHFRKGPVVLNNVLFHQALY
jgi:hypothetical protein